MQSVRINKLYTAILVFIPIILTSSLLQGRVTFFAREWFWLAIGCVLCFMIYPSYIKQRNIAWLLIYAIIVFLNFLQGDNYFNSTTNIIMEIATLFFCSYLAFYLVNDSGNFIYYFVFTQIIAITITALLSIAVDMVFPGVIRETVMLVNGGESDKAVPFYSMGVCHYSFPHGIPMILPGLVLILKNRKFRIVFRLSILLLLILLFYLIFVSSVSTAVILAILGIISSFFISEGNLRKNLSRLIVLGLFLTPLLSDTIMMKILTAAEEIVPAENNISTKIISFEESIESKHAEGSLDKRGEKYAMSFDAFLSNPIIGTDNRELGGHAALLDRLGALGFVGFIPFVLIIFSMVKLIKRKIPSNAVVFFNLGVLGFLLMILTKNMSNLYVWMYSFCLLPALIIFNSKPPRFFLK